MLDYDLIENHRQRNWNEFNLKDLSSLEIKDIFVYRKQL